MQHQLIRQLRRIHRVPLVPIVADGVGEDRASPVEGRRADGAAHLRVALEAVLGVAVPEVKGAVAAGGAESAVLGVEGDGVDGEDVGDVASVGRGLPVAFEGEVRAGDQEVRSGSGGMEGAGARRRLTWNPSLPHIGSHIALLCSRLQSRSRR